MYTIFVPDKNISDNSYKYTKWYDTNCPMHCHSYFELVIVLSGTLDVEKDSKHYILDKNDIIAIMPFENHKFNTRGKSHIAVLEIPTALISSFDTILKNKTPENPCCTLENSELTFIFEHLKNANSNTTVELNCIVFTVFSLILKNTRLISYDEPTDIFKKAIVYTNNHYEQNICLKDVAEALNVNYVYLSRLFTKNNVSFSDFINGFRVHKAVNMLKNTKLTISEICFECGFGSIRNFNRVFLKLMNCTPNDFREKYNSTYVNVYGEFL